MPPPSIQAIAWQPDFATGSAIIDDQHRVLIKMLNDADTKLDDRSPLADYESIVKGLLSYAGYHFKTEEDMMVRLAYGKDHPATAERHLDQHREFAASVQEVQRKIAAGEHIPKADLVKFLTDWLSNHILHTDKEFGAFVRDAQLQAGKTGAA